MTVCGTKNTKVVMRETNIINVEGFNSWARAPSSPRSDAALLTIMSLINAAVCFQFGVVNPVKFWRMFRFKTSSG